MLSHLFWKEYPLTLNGIKTWCLLLARGGGLSDLPCVWLANDIWDSTYFNRNSCQTSCRQYVQITFVLWTEPSGRVLKVNLPFISPFSIYFHFRFSIHCFFPERQPCFFFFWVPFLFFCHPLDEDYRCHRGP